MINEKLYEKFSSNERVDLVLAALARGDHEEAIKLRRSCPEIIYTINELEFSRAFVDITRVFSIFSLICVSYFNKVLLTRIELTAVITTTNFPDMNVFKSMTEDEQLANIQSMLAFTELVEFKNKEIISYLSYVKSAYHALENFCTAVDISYAHLKKWLNVTPLDELPVGVDRYSISLAISQPEYVIEIQELLLSHWSGRSSPLTQ